jgi:hypothetical protein
MANFHTKFHTSDCSGLLVIAIKLKAKENFCMTAKLLFYIVCSSVSIVTKLQARNFLFSLASRLDLGHTSLLSTGNQELFPQA